jgi:phosphatidylglycerol:prolipoprotein diacylglycerol transferase
MFPVIFSVGPFTLHTYGLLVALGFLAGYTWSRREFLRQGLNSEAIDMMILGMMLSAIVGARLFYYLFSGEYRDFSNDPLAFLRIWEGGLVFYGGFIGAIVFIVVFARRKEIPLVRFTDAFAAPLLLAQAIGRLGCFAAGCCYGRPTSSFLGVTFTDPLALAPRFIPLHPTQLYSAGGDLLLLGLLLLLRKRRPEIGFPTAYYLIAYGLGRFLIEFVRFDDRGPSPWGLTPSQWLSLAAIIIGGVVYTHVQKRTQS